MNVTAEQAFARALVQSLVGERGHLPIARALSDIDLQLAGQQVAGLPYTIYQLVSHMRYWQDFMLAHVRGEQPSRPPSVADSWLEHTNAADEASWQVVLDDFLQGIDSACELANTLELAQPLALIPTETIAGFLRNIASHNTYHLGEIVIIRRLLGSWPPPGGGYPA
ncbi:DinB family protein [Paenibacillus sp. SGZ-1009]|uniref:DinB family protein n=1 Tax=Paenibacillus campi TaxID=3106031 RepID=UPI002AFDE479|nr:DinB family protein [Paenibacillus sp. SGZ-1009]